MKKSIIAAGAASVALAAMPIVGAMAATTYYGSPIVDTLTLTLSEVCTLSRKTTAHPAGANEPTGAAWNDTASATNDDDTFTASITAGTDYADIAESAFNVTCNNADDGYKVTVAVSGFADDWAYNKAGKVADTSTWSLTSSAKANVQIDNGDKVWESATGTQVTTGGDFTITYNVYPDINQASNVYTATATYTLADLGV